MTGLGKLLSTTAFRLSLIYLSVFIVFAGAVIGYLAWQTNALVSQQITDTINVEIAGLSDQYRVAGIRGLVETVEERSRQPGASLYIVTAPNGQPLAGNVGALPAGVFDQPGWLETDYQRVDQEGEQAHRAIVRVFVAPGGFRLLVGRDIEERERFRSIVWRVAQSALVLVVVLGLVGGFFVSRRVLARIEAVTDASRTIMGGDLGGRIPVTGSGDEFDRLAESLNAMLARIGELMRGMQEVSDNIAHDLKTPLTRLRNRAEAAMREANTVDEYRAALGRMIEESDHLIRTFEALLMIARAQAGQAREGFATVDLGAVLRDVVELYDVLAEEAGGTVRLDCEDGLQVLGNREILGQAFANLLDNAVKHGLPHGADGAEIMVMAKARGEFVEVIIADRGAGIPAEDRTRVLERFVRLERAQTLPGSGLGLSLVAAVARLHDGTISLEDGAPGLVVRLTLPRIVGEKGANGETGDG